MYQIPDEFRDLPEALRLKQAQSEFRAASQQGRHLPRDDKDRLRTIGEQLRRAQVELQKAQAAFDAATGEPKPVGLTPAVLEEIARHFPPEQRPQVSEFLDRACGRTIPLRREATAQELEYIRLCVLRLSKGDLVELRKWVELANKDERDVLVSVGQSMTGENRR